MSKVGKTLGYSSLALVSAVWIAFWLSSRFVPADWFPWIYLIANVAAAVAGILGIIAGRLNSKLWYYSAFLGFATAAFLLAGVAD